jgi:hypothetical protein
MTCPVIIQVNKGLGLKTGVIVSFESNGSVVGGSLRDCQHPRVKGGEIPMTEEAKSGGNSVVKISWFGWLGRVKE